MEHHIINNSLLDDVSLTLDEDDNYKLVEYSFFKTYVYNEHVNGMYKTSKLYHFQDILTDEGFNITSMYDPQNLEKGSQDEMTQIMGNITN